MAVALMYLGVWSWSRQTPELQTECHNGKNVSNFECGMTFGACWCQIFGGRSEYFTICSVTGIFTHNHF